MAGHLVKKGFEVTAFNRSRDKAEKWRVENGGILADSLPEAVKNAEVVCICVGDDNDLENVLFGSSGALANMPQGGIVINHTTCSAVIELKAYAKAKSLGIGYMDAPVSGGGVGAQKGALTTMVGGNEADFETVKEILGSYCANVNMMGEIGAGQRTKMMNQILISATLQGVAEAIAFGEKAGLDVEKALFVLSKGAAQSWQLENRGPWMIDGRYKDGGFTVDLIAKDLGLVTNEANDLEAQIKVTKMVEDFFHELQADGKGRWDFSSLIELVRSK